jgi:hypothetical protein
MVSRWRSASARHRAAWASCSETSADHHLASGQPELLVEPLRAGAVVDPPRDPQAGEAEERRALGVLDDHQPGEPVSARGRLDLPGVVVVDEAVAAFAQRVPAARQLVDRPGDVLARHDRVDRDAVVVPALDPEDLVARHR